MSIQAKQQFVYDVTQEIGDFLTVTNTNKVSNVLTDHLDSYELNEIQDDQLSQSSLDYLNLFLDAKRIEGRSEKTVDRYSYILEKALRNIGTPANKITVFHIRSYLMEEKKRGLQDSSIEGLRSVLSSFFTWLWKEGLIQSNPSSNIGPVKCQKKIRLPYSATDIERLKSACTCPRDKAIICFLLATGARISEVCALNRDDVDFQKLECTVLGKGNKQRTVYMNEVTAMELQSYLKARTDDSPALFVGRGSDRMTDQGIRAVLVELGKRSGVENVHPHRFRRTLATSLINHGMPLQEVAAILGHENVNTTLKYVYISQNNVKNSYRKYA